MCTDVQTYVWYSRKVQNHVGIFDVRYSYCSKSWNRQRAGISSRGTYIITTDFRTYYLIISTHLAKRLKCGSSTCSLNHLPTVTEHSLRCTTRICRLGVCILCCTDLHGDVWVGRLTIFFVKNNKKISTLWHVRLDWPHLHLIGWSHRRMSMFLTVAVTALALVSGSDGTFLLLPA